MRATPTPPYRPALRATVVAAGEGAEALLPGCVPHGQLQPLTVKV